MQPVSLAGQGLFLSPRQNIVAIGMTPQRTGRTAIYGVVLFRYHWKKMAFLWEHGIEGQLWGRYSYFRSWPKAAEMHIAIKQTFDKLGKISRTAAFGEILKSPLPAKSRRCVLTILESLLQCFDID
jgi:hypothetical protein